MHPSNFKGLGHFINIETDYISGLVREPGRENIQWTFPNGYGGSLACNELTQGDPEFAVMKDGKLHYKTDITNDTIRGVYPSEVQEFLNKLKEL